MEMPGGGKRGKPKAGFPLSHRLPISLRRKDENEFKKSSSESRKDSFAALPIASVQDHLALERDLGFQDHLSIGICCSSVPTSKPSLTDVGGWV
jgi:hypothetical protein